MSENEYLSSYLMEMDSYGALLFVSDVYKMKILQILREQRA